MIRIIRFMSLGFAVMLMLMAPTGAWNVPGANYDSEKCCFSESCWNQKPSGECSFTAKDLPSWDWYSKEWRSYGEDGHIYLLQNGIRLLQEKGYDNWAAYLAEGDHFQALADGATWADTYKGRWWGRLYLTALFGAIKIQLGEDFNLCNMAGYDHYYSDFSSSPAGKGLKDVDEGQIATFVVDELGAFISGLALNLALSIVGPIIPIVGPLVQTLQTIGMIGLSFEFSPSLDSSYPSAAVLSEQRLESAVDSFSNTYDPSVIYWDRRSNEYNSLFQAGWAVHYAQDTGVLYHIHDIWSSLMSPHNAFEDASNGLGDPAFYPEYHLKASPSNTEPNYGSRSVMEIVQQGAMVVDDAADWEKAKSDDPAVRREGLKNGLRVSEQVTADILAEYLTQLQIPQKVPTFSGFVRDATTGAPVSGAYVFYREKLGFSGHPDIPGGIQAFTDQTKPWNYVRSDLNGKYSLNLIQGRVYYIRAEHPAYQYRGYINVSTQEPMGQQITLQPVEFQQPLAGKAMSGIDYILYLSPRSPGDTSPPSPLILETNLLPLTGVVSMGAAAQLEQAVLTVRADTTALAAQAPQEPYPLSLPGETYIGIEVANLVNLGTGEVVTSSPQLTSVLTDAGPKWRMYKQALMTPERYQIPTVRKAPDAWNPQIPSPAMTVDRTALQTSPVQWQFKISDQFSTTSENLRLVSGAVPLASGAAIDTGISPHVIGEVKSAAPKTQFLLPDGNISEASLLTYSFGRLSIIDAGQPLYENHLARIPADNVQIEVTLEQGSGLIGPEFNLIPSLQQSAKVVTTPSGLVQEKVLAPVNPLASPTPSPCPAGSTPIPDPKGGVACVPVKATGTSTQKQLILRTNSEGRTAFLLRTGSQAGAIRLHVRVTDNPAASGIKPSETLNVVVHPPISWIESSFDPVVPPSLGVVTPRHTLSVLYALPFVDQPTTRVDTGLCLNFSEGAEQTIQVNLLKCQAAPVILRTDLPPTPVLEKESSIFSPLIGVWDFVISIPEKVGDLFLGQPEQPPVPGERDLGQRCDDQNLCTVNDRSVDGSCMGDPIVCNDRNPETVDSCDPSRGCIFRPIGEPIEGSPCDDGDRCTAGDRWLRGVCSGEPMECNDRNPDTVDSCDPGAGCVFTPIEIRPGEGEGCNDENLCTANDRFLRGICSGDPIVCDDRNAETADTCDPTTGCVFTPLQPTLSEERPCDDGNLCTMNDRYIGRICTGDLVVCNDRNPETTDSCDPARGCVFTRIGEPIEGSPCDDGNLCTQNDRILRGICLGEPVTCDDRNPETTDTCDPGVGCVFTPLESQVSRCPEGCTCLLETEAAALYERYTQCSETPCAYVEVLRAGMQPKFCYRPVR